MSPRRAGARKGTAGDKGAGLDPYFPPDPRQSYTIIYTFRPSNVASELRYTVTLIYVVARTGSLLYFIL